MVLGRARFPARLLEIARLLSWLRKNFGEVKAQISLRQVLLIDDNALQLSVREAVLRNAGFQVAARTASAGTRLVVHSRALPATPQPR